MPEVQECVLGSAAEEQEIVRAAEVEGSGGQKDEEGETVAEALHGIRLPAKEQHDVEFKTTFSELKAGARTVVAFANAHGGDLYFGIQPDGTPVGETIGRNTIERLPDELGQYIYPYAPVAVYEIPLGNGKSVAQVSVAADTPPVIGVYLYSSSRLPPDQRVQIGPLTAYRRVGRTNRKVPDFMWLRAHMWTDPIVLITRGGGSSGRVIPAEIGGTAWLADGSGPAHALRFRMEPDLASARNGERDLPRLDGFRRSTYSLNPTQPVQPLEGAWVIVEYMDDWGCLWETRRYLEFQGGEAIETNKMERRIVELPPKNGTA